MPTAARTRYRPGRVMPAVLLFAALICILPVAVSPAAAESGIPFADAHTHLLRHLSEAGGGGYGGGGRRASAGLSPSAIVSTALALMDRFGVSYAILAPPPLPARREGAAGSPELQAVARQYPTRFAFSAGGESLNPVIQSTPPGNVTADVLGRFQEEARAIAEAGAAAFGELAAEHFSSRIGNHPYESVPPDHPLFLALADIAAQYNMPIELHMGRRSRVICRFPMRTSRARPIRPASSRTSPPWSGCSTTIRGPGSSQGVGESRCRQSVARCYSNLHGLKGARW